MIHAERERLSGWGMWNECTAVAYHPHDVAEVAESSADAASRNLTIAHRGAGISYGDAALNEGGAIIHMAALNRIQEFDAERGTVRAEAGVTIGQLWRHVLPFGWWPPIVPGTMHVTIGGAAAMNIHGKNGYRAGCFGDYVRALTLLDSCGVVHHLTIEHDAERIRQIVGAMGLNGTILDVTLELKRVCSGMLNVSAVPTATLEENLDKLDALARDNEYAVGWIDAFAQGRSLGRGLLHAASNQLADDVNDNPRVDLSSQDLPSRLFGVLPARHAWRMMRPLMHKSGMRAINLAKNLSGRAGGTKSFLQPHAAFHFLLDYIPNWKFAYRPGGLLQYQFFAPFDAALPMFREALLLQHRAGLPSYLAVLKRHRANAFAASYCVDGFSLALDFPIARRDTEPLMKLLHAFDALQRSMGGRIYAAKDSVSHGKLPCTRDSRYSSNLARRWEKSA